MNTQNANPFVLPGMGQTGDTAGNPLLASMEMMRQAWAGLAGTGGLAQMMPLAAPMDTGELERRIAELQTVENWLRLNLSMLTSTIQGLEVQRATIATLRAFAGGTGQGSATQEAAAPDASAASFAAGAAESASQAWWELLQNQFNQIAAATAASMPGAAIPASAQPPAASTKSATPAASAPSAASTAPGTPPAGQASAKPAAKRAAPRKKTPPKA